MPVPASRRVTAEPAGPPRRLGAVRARSPAADVLTLQRTAGNAAVTALIRARRQVAPRRTLARMLIVGGMPVGASEVTLQRVREALAGLKPPAQAKEVRAVRDRLMAWAAAEGAPGSFANWASFKDAALAVSEGLARIEQGWDSDAGVDALNRVSVAAPGPVGRILSDVAAAAFGAPVPHTPGTFTEGSAAVSPTEAERKLSFVYFYPPETTQGASAETVRTTMLSVIDMSSCHYSALQLEGLLGGGRVEERQGGQRKLPEGADLRPYAEEMTKAIRELAAMIRASAEKGPEKVFNIQYASHSFTVVTTQDRVEMLQSFAGGGGYPLGTGISRGQQWAPADYERLFVAALAPTTFPATSGDSVAQRELFGGSVFDDKDFQWPAVTLRVRACPLATKEEITRRAKERIAANLPVYEKAIVSQPERKPTTAERTRTKKKEPRVKKTSVTGGGVRKPKITYKARRGRKPKVIVRR